MRKCTILLTAFAMGCASAPKQEKKVEASVYTRGSYSVMAADVGKDSCPTDLKKLSNENWKAVVQKGNACVKAGNWKQVEEIANYMAKSEPQSPWGSYFLSLHSEQAGDLERAQWMVELSLKKAPGLGILHYQKGRLYYKKNDINGAIESFKTAVAADGTLTDAHALLGQIYYRDQDFDPAAAHFYQVLRTRPQDAVALSGLAECRLQKGDVQGALEIFKRGAKAHPEEVTFALREAFIHETHLNEPAEALTIYRDIKNKLAKSKNPIKVEVNLDDKIHSLTASVEKLAQREPASKKEKKQ